MWPGVHAAPERQVLRGVDDRVPVEEGTLVDDETPALPPRGVEDGYVLLARHVEQLVPADRRAVLRRRGRVGEREAPVHRRVVREHEHVAGLEHDAHAGRVGRGLEALERARQRRALRADVPLLTAGEPRYVQNRAIYNCDLLAVLNKRLSDSRISSESAEMIRYLRDKSTVDPSCRL